MAAIVPARTSGYIAPHWSERKCSQVFVESVLLYSNQYIDKFMARIYESKRFVIEIPMTFLFLCYLKTTCLNVAVISYGML